MTDLTKKKCVPCEGNTPPLTPEAAAELQKQLKPDWMIVDNAHLLTKHFSFKNFAQTMEFVNKIAAVAEEEGHHPDLTVTYGGVTVELMTHAIGGLSDNDFILAAKIDALI